MNTKRLFKDKYESCLNIKHIETQWLVGFIDSEGSFYNRLTKRQKGGYDYIETESTLSIGQNIHDIGLLLAIQKFFDGAG